MARVKKEEDFNVKRNEILDVAQQFIYTQGYEQMSIQHIVAALQISKGAFYHYFDSKPDLLNALIERIMQEAFQVLQPIIEDPKLSAVEKLQVYFATAARWKTARKDYLMAILRAWYQDENTIVRQKIFTAGLAQIAPMLTRVFQQGNQEGSFQVERPEQTGQVIMSLFQGVGETIARQMLALEGRDRQAALQEMLDTAAAYNLAIERMLGAPRGTFDLFDAETLRKWIDE